MPMLTDPYGDPLPAGAIRRLGTMRFGQTDPVTALAFAPDNKTLASGAEDRSVRLWDVASGKQLRHFGEHPDKISALTFSADGKMLASGSRDGIAYLWDVASGRTLRELPPQGGAVFAFAFSADGKLLVSAAADQIIRFWELANGRETNQIKSDMGPVHAIAFSPDGKTIGTGSWESIVRLCDLATGKELRTFQGHRSWVQSITYSPDGRMLASGSGDETIRLWEIATGKERLRYEGQKQGVFSLAFSPDGRSLASAGSDAAILVWNATVQLPDAAKRRGVLSTKQLESLWFDLPHEDAGLAFQTIGTLASLGAQAVSIIKTRLPLLVPPNPLRVASLVADLNHDLLATREKATQELEKLGVLCEPALRAALLKKPGTEVRRRLDRLLERLQGPVPALEALHALRAIETLELLAVPEAKQLLEGLVRQMPATVIAQEAKAALERLARKKGA